VFLEKHSVKLNALSFREKGEGVARELGGSVEFLSFDMDDASALRTAIDGLHLDQLGHFIMVISGFYCVIFQFNNQRRSSL